jgi:hypothetical protein
MAMSMMNLNRPYTLPTTNGVAQHSFKALDVQRTHYFGAVPPRIDHIEPVGARSTAEYDPTVAYVTTVASAWAYSDGQTMANQLPYFGLPNCTVKEFIVANGAMLVIAAAYLIRSSDGQVGFLAFRGTVPNDILNWLTDANTTLTNFHFGRVHTGFYRNVEPLWGFIAEEIDRAMAPSQPVEGQKPMVDLYITGHSLGAAMAVIAAARIFTTRYDSWQPLVRGVYTYGQPSVGDQSFCDTFQERFALYRHVYGFDIVPHLPSQELGKFPHFGVEFYAPNPGSGWQQEKPPRVTQARMLLEAAALSGASYIARRIAPFERLRLPYSIEDHGPQGYIDTSRNSLH